jgi:Las17-binding protein actin regulator
MCGDPMRGAYAVPLALAVRFWTGMPNGTARQGARTQTECACRFSPCDGSTPDLGPAHSRRLSPAGPAAAERATRRPARPMATFVIDGVGGSYGRGAMVCRSGASFDGAWGSPAMYAIEGGSFALQLGAQSTDLVLLVMNTRGVEAFLSTKVQLGANMSAAAGPRDVTPALPPMRRCGPRCSVHPQQEDHHRSGGALAGGHAALTEILADELLTDREEHGRHKWHPSSHRACADARRAARDRGGRTAPWSR